MKNTVIGVAALVLLTSSAAQAEDLRFVLRNTTDEAVTGFYVSHTGTDDWEENLVPDDSALYGGYEVNVNITDGRDTCEYDILVEFEDGSEVKDYDMNLCELGTYTVEYD